MDEPSKPVEKGFVPLILIGILLWGFYLFFGGEREGEVKYSDCREIIKLSDNPIQLFYKKFTCTYEKTASGRIRRGTCVHIEHPFSLFRSNNECDIAYLYYKEQEDVCPKDYPVLQYDDKCAKY
ncbi:MAG: hypothetical protein WC654_04260 [Patescibacteria group bacterium]